MRRAILTILAFFFLVGVSYGDVRVWGLTGAYWGDLSTQDKVLYIGGVMDASTSSDLDYSGSYDGYVAGLDEFYKDERNRYIPVFWGIGVVSQGMKGRCVEKRLEYLRGRFNE